ncbi:unnamed protein product [Rotaria sordida]|uniref:HAT C-terminal dimerisation domain-containing protein n=1 Tax=Rotaria sordida TaxID=392033 RepID=A0A816CKZ3_9BILA|nr:unnamed protein product [Rotaria sordida]CAF1626342.1 unnamed protein product [Rotaria sordida]
MFSSNENEIINVSILSNDKFSKEPQSLRVNNTVSVSSKADSYVKGALSSSSKVNKRYITKFKNEWLSYLKFSIFLRECKTDPAKTFAVKPRILEFIEQVHESVGALFENIKYILEVNQLKLSLFVSAGSDNTNCTTGVNLHNIITTSLHKLNNRVHDDFFDHKVDQLLKKIRCPVEVNNLKESFRLLTRTLINYIETYYNTKTTISNEETLCDDCDVENNSNDEDDDDDEYDVKCRKDKTRDQFITSNHLWSYLLVGEKVLNLKKLIQFVFVIPTSNSFCESIVSHTIYTKDTNRNKMQHDLIGAELNIKMNTDHICTQF